MTPELQTGEPNAKLRSRQVYTGPVLPAFGEVGVVAQLIVPCKLAAPLRAN